MRLKRLTILNFKNIPEATLDFTARINCFVGGNGEGKTNAVDAIYYLSMCKSAQGMTDSQCVRHGEEQFVLEGEYATDGGRREDIVCGFRRGGEKNFRRAGKEYDRLGEHIGMIPVVIVSPSDVFLIHDAPDQRRKYLNGLLSQSDPEYLPNIVRYNHILEERNKLLKSGSAGGDVLDVLDMQLCRAGEAVFAKRSQIVQALAPLAGEYYRALSDDREQVELKYNSELADTPFDELLAASRERDRLNQFTTCGVHRDDLKMTIGGYMLRKYGSQGQQKSFLVALKLAQYTLTARLKNEKPILLLDDLFDKLDLDRVERLLQLVSDESFGQIFITDCNKVRLESILDRSGEPYALFGVEGGKISQQ